MHRILLRALFLNFILIGLFNILPCQAAKPIAVPTFHSIGLYYSPKSGSEDNACHVQYKILGERGWKQGQDLWFDARNGEYRGSLVNLIPGVTYKIKLMLEKKGRPRKIIATTWKEQFPIGDTVYLDDGTTTVEVKESGTADAYRLYTHPQGAETVIDVNNQADHSLEISASYVIIRGLVLKNARVHAIRLLPGAHNVIIENCNISGWGRIAADGWGVNEDAGIYSNSADIERIVIQRNKIHHPRSDSNSWTEEREIYGFHPAGPKAIVLKASAGNHVIRYNEIYSDDDHYFNDCIGESGNFGPGFPNADTDIYGNHLEGCWDDGIESEGHNRNVRIWNNYIDRATIGIASAPVHEGPLYIWRNVMYSSRKGPLPEHNYGQPLIKLGGGRKNAASPYYGDGKTYIFHNTSLIPPAGSGLAGHSTQINAHSRELRNCVTRNNILESASHTHPAILNETEDPQNDFDYDLFNGYIHWGADIFEQNGIQGYPVYAENIDYDYERAEGTGNFHQALSSPGYDAGLPIANFNDKYTGDAPDMGAHEAGTPPMRFGVKANYLNPQGLVGLWPFDERRRFADIIDKSGNGNIGVIYGNTLRKKGVYGRALKFKGDSDYVEIVDPGESALDVTADLSISLWVKRRKDTPGDQWFLSKSGSYAWKFSNGRAYFFIYTPQLSVIESSPIPIEQWHHLAAVYDYSNQEVRIYVDGALDAASYPVSGTIATSDASLLFGHHSDACFFGRLDDVHLYDRVLSEGEILELAGIMDDNPLAAYFNLDEGQGIDINDVSGNGNTGTLFGDTSWVSGKSGTGLEFDGNSDYVEIKDNSGSLAIYGDFSIALWIKITESTGSDDWFFAKPGTYAWKITNNTPYFLIYTLDNPDPFVVTPSQLNLNQWHHLAAAYDQSAQTVTVYIDGALDTSAWVGGELKLTSYDYILGGTGAACLNGILDEVRIFSKALNLSEVRELYVRQQFANLAGYWGLDEGAGTIATDGSGNGNDGTLSEGEGIGWVEGISGTALSFEGDKDYVRIPDTSGDLAITRDLSISLWIKRTAATGGDEWFISKSGAYAWKLSNGIPYFWIFTPNLTHIGGSPISLNEWHHLAAVYDYDPAGGAVSIYIDGVPDPPQTVSGEMPSTQGDLILGADSNACVIGILDDIRIFNAALSAEAISQLFQGN